jgi:hypothetical protein
MIIEKIATKSQNRCPCTLNHIIVRGIERRKILYDDSDRGPGWGECICPATMAENLLCDLNTGGDIFRYDPVKCQKMVKLSEGLYHGFCDMNGGIVVVRREIDQMTVTNPFDRTDSSCFKKNG